LLEGIAGNPEQRLSELPLLSAGEREQVLEQWNATAVDYGEAACLHELFEQQVEETPAAVAVVQGRIEVSYRELEERANRLGNYLRKLGVGPEVRVGICVGRSVEMVVGLLGILKAGGAYVPLDPTYPAERIRYMVEDSQAGVVITEEKLLQKLPEGGIRVVCLDQQGEEIAGESGRRARSGVQAESMAYIYYTSGSTGRPKGVVMAHSGIVNYMRWGVEAYEARGGHGAAVHSSIAVDLTLTNFLPLFVGEKMVLAEEMPGVEGLVELLQGKPEWSLLKVTPTHLTLLNTRLTAEEMRHSTRVLVIGADNLVAEPTLVWREQAPGVKLVNEYGPTETVVGCSIYRIEAGAPRSGGMPIGKPIANMRMYLLDKEGQPVPVGVVGELYIGGIGVARGYWGRPELTAERFLPDPYGGEAGGRYYRTGDRARLLGDGDVEFLGRVDHQVKIRGYRIEPAEVEAVLSGCAGVQKAMVVVREDVPGEKRLVGYVAVGDKGRSGVPGVGELREYLKERLPEYMVPSAWVMMEELPVRGSGKIDPKDLPRPEQQGLEELETAGPRTPEEEILCGIFAEVLNLDRIGVGRNFFEAGGHSLLATRAISRMRSVFGVELPFRALFEVPTAAGLAERIVAARGARTDSVMPIVHVSRESDLPLSYAQQRLWFLNQLEPESAAYHIPFAVRLSGELNLEILEKSVNAIVRRHEVLRTSFATRNGNPVQVISAELNLNVEVADLRHMEGLQREAEIRRLAAAESARPFDLERGPLLRMKLLQLEEQDHVLLAVMHHIVSDGWSVGIMMREFAELYSSCLRGEESRLPRLEIQYADFAVWQRQWLQGRILEEQLGYWRKQLAGVPMLEMPTDYPRPTVTSHRGAKVELRVGRDLTEKLRELGRREGVTLFMTLLAGCKVILSRYANQHDIAVATPIANRNRIETEALIGFFVNTLVLRTEVSGDLDFKQVLTRVRHVALDGYQHQDVPFEKLVEELQPERDRSRSPLFQVMLVLHNTEQQVLQLPGLRVSGCAIESGIEKFDLSLGLWESADGLGGEISYACDLYKAETIERLAGHLRQVLEQMVSGPGCRIGELVLLTAEEREQVLVGWNQTKAEYPLGCVHQLFEEQAARTPDAVAVICGEQNLTYGELNEKAERLASYLVEAGVEIETRVGIYLRRSLELLIGVLGVLKAGATYVPVEPGLPKERIEYMMENAGIEWVLVEAATLGDLALAGVDVVMMDGAGTDADWLEEMSMEERRSETEEVRMRKRILTAENLAYIIYTSGSTGQPKGVAVTHHGLANYLQWAVRAYDFRPGTPSLWHSSLSFDLTVTSIYPALLTGGCIEILPQSAEFRDIPEHLGFGNQYLLKLTPGHLQILNGLLEKDSGTAKKAKALVIGGEMLRYGDLDFWLSAAPGARLINEYGPTETVVGCCIYEVTGNEQLRGSVPIGKAISNTRMYILDELLQPVPVGMKGEIYIGGAGVARGYWDRPELTGERFVPDPFSQTGGERLYRAGDVGRYRSDGNIEYLGRTDHQVKLRGYRIELGEIESVLATHSAVRQAVVVAREDEQDDKRLVGYVVLADGHGIPTLDQLKNHLRTRLPEYMVPAALVALDRIPLTPNGKLDTRALPKLETTTVADDVPLYDEITAQLEKIWRELLKAPRIGLRQTFFELGGHSLLALKLIRRIKEQFGRELALSAVFEAATVEQMSQLLRRGAHPEHRSNLVPILPHGTKRPLFFVHPGGGGIGVYRHLASLLGKDQPFYGLQALDDEENEQEAILSIEQRAAQYIAALKTIDPEGPYILGGWSMGGYIAYEMAQQLKRQNREVAGLLLLDIAARTPSELPCSGDEAEQLLHVAREKGATQLSLDAVNDRSAEERLQYLLDQTQGAGIFDSGLEITIPMIRSFLKALRRREQSVLDYTLHSYNGPVTLIRAGQDIAANHPQVDPADTTAGFAALCPNLEVVFVPGTHFDLIYPPHVDGLADVIRKSLQSIEAREIELHSQPSFATQTA